MTPERLAEIRTVIDHTDACAATMGVVYRPMIRDLLAHIDTLAGERDAYRDHPAILVSPAPPKPEVTP